MNTSMDILGVEYEFGPSVFYLFGPLVIFFGPSVFYLFGPPDSVYRTSSLLTYHANQKLRARVSKPPYSNQHYLL